MADVLHRLTKLYLRSVNTPDYPLVDWVLNPDLSAVTGLPIKYWVIDTTQVETQELDYIDDFDNPVYKTVLIQVDTIRAMTAQEQLDYDAAHPEVVVATALTDGMPAYTYGPYNGPISVEQVSLSFSMPTKNAKNFYLSYMGLDGSDNGFVLPRNALIKTISASFRRDLGSDVTLHFRETGSAVDKFSVVVEQGLKSKQFVDLAHLLDAGTSISVFVSSASGCANPLVVCTLGWRN